MKTQIELVAYEGGKRVVLAVLSTRLARAIRAARLIVGHYRGVRTVLERDGTQLRQLTSTQGQHLDNT